MGRKISKAQRRAFARIVYHAFHTLEVVANTTKIDEWFLEALTETEVQELAKLKRMTNKLADKWRELAWKLEGRNAS